MYANVVYIASSKLTLNFTGQFSKNKSALEQVNMPDPPYLPADTSGNNPVNVFLDARDYDYSNMYTYSDLDYSILRGGFGFDYRFSPSVTWTAGVTYIDLTDDAGGYVYGDETGSYFTVRAGLRYDF